MKTHPRHHRHPWLICGYCAGIRQIQLGKLYHTDFDKRHRCPNPECGGSLITEGRVEFWRIYTCPRCRTRAANRPLLPVFPGTWYPFHGQIGWKWRIEWFWWRDPLRWLVWQRDSRGRRIYRLGVYYLALGYWNACDVMDKIPGFTDAVGRIYNERVDDTEEEEEE